MLDTLWQDLRHGARMLLKNPGFTLVAVVSIAIGVGANAAMFSVADGLVLRPLPVPRAGEVVTVSAVDPAAGTFNFNTRLSYPDYADLRGETQSFDDLVAYRLVITSFANRPDELVQRRIGLAISGNLFDAMEVRPALGRPFRLDEDRVPGRDAVVILDYDEWAQQFGSDPGVLNRRIRIGGAEFTVIGVAPEGFTSIDHDLHPAFYIPLAMFATVQPGVPPDEATKRDARTLTVKGRLKPGVTIARARREVQQIAVNLARSYPDTNRNWSLTVQTELEAFTSRPGSTDAVLVAMLMTLALAVFLVACANVAGLLTSRAPVRAREIALRLAVGAGRGRLIRQLVTESLLIAGAGGALGFALASGVIAMFQRVEFPTDIPLRLSFALDTRVLVVGIVAAAVGAILSSLVPAWQSTRADLVSSIKDSHADLSRRSRLWGRSALVCGQVSLALVLLSVSVFMYRSFQAELDRGPGFRTDRLLMMTFEPGLARYDEARTTEFYRLLKERARATLGVTSVTLTSSVPMRTGNVRFAAMAPEGFQFPRGTKNVTVPSSFADEDFLDTMSISIVRGRGFRPTDTKEAPRVAVVNQTFATRYWPGQDAIGKRIRLDDDGGAFAEVVGVAANAKYFFIVESPLAYAYFPHAQNASRQTTLVVATAGAAAAMADPLRAVVRSIDPNMPVFSVRTMEDFYAGRIVYTTRLLVGSVGGMGSLGLVLAMVGLYGLVAYSTARRTREIGIRMAVGANPGSVLRMVLRHGFGLALAGIVVGLAGSIAAGRLLTAAFATTQVINLETTRGTELVNNVLVVTGLVAVVLLATYMPARRAARIDPLVALRTE